MINSNFLDQRHDVKKKNNVKIFKQHLCLAIGLGEIFQLNRQKRLKSERKSANARFSLFASARWVKRFDDY